MSAQARLVRLGKWKRFGPWRLLNKQKHCTVESLAWYGYSPKEMIADIVHLFPKLSNLRSYSNYNYFFINRLGGFGQENVKNQHRARLIWGGSVPFVPSSLSLCEVLCGRSNDGTEDHRCCGVALDCVMRAGDPSNVVSQEYLNRVYKNIQNYYSIQYLLELKYRLSWWVLSWRGFTSCDVALFFISLYAMDVSQIARLPSRQSSCFNGRRFHPKWGLHWQAWLIFPLAMTSQWAMGV